MGCLCKQLPLGSRTDGEKQTITLASGLPLLPPWSGWGERSLSGFFPDSLTKWGRGELGRDPGLTGLALRVLHPFEGGGNQAGLSPTAHPCSKHALLKPGLVLMSHWPKEPVWPGLQEDTGPRTRIPWASRVVKARGLIHFPECTRLCLTSGSLHSLFLNSATRCSETHGCRAESSGLWRSCPPGGAHSRGRNRPVTLAGENSSGEINQGSGQKVPGSIQKWCEVRPGRSSEGTALWPRGSVFQMRPGSCPTLRPLLTCLLPHPLHSWWLLVLASRSLPSKALSAQRNTAQPALPSAHLLPSLGELTRS